MKRSPAYGEAKRRILVRGQPEKIRPTKKKKWEPSALFICLFIRGFYYCTTVKPAIYYILILHSFDLFLNFFFSPRVVLPSLSLQIIREVIHILTKVPYDIENIVFTVVALFLSIFQK